MYLVKVEGGSKDNAIPLESKAAVVFAKGTDMKAVYAVIQDFNAILSVEYRVTDPNIKIVVSPVEEVPYVPMTKLSTQRIITALFNMPWGIQKMSPEIEGLVQTSLNMGILKSDTKKVVCSFSVRSSVESEKNELVERLECLTEMLDGSFLQYGDYPAWEYVADSKLRDIMIDVFEKQYGRKPIVQALHAGVECGLFAGKIEGLDCVSFGPDLKDVHTFNETLDLESAERTWNYLLGVLEALK
jgi:dipeptidase D